MSLNRRRRQSVGRNVCRKSQQGRREREFRLHGPLDPQSTGTFCALLSERETRSDAGRLRKTQPAIRLRYRTPLALPERWRGVASPEYDGDAKLPSVRVGRARHCHISILAFFSSWLCSRLFHGRSQYERKRPRADQTIRLCWLS